jgi:hypothetical protein
VKALCERAKEILLQEDNVVKVEAPITVSLFPSTFEFSYLDLWRHSWTVLRLNGTFESWRRMPSHKLLVHGRFCR